MADIKQRTSAILAKVADLKKSRRDTIELVTELEKIADKLPASAKAALDNHINKKQGKK